MKRPRFTLRFLLVVVTFAALGLGLWRVAYTRHSIARRDAQTIEIGTSDWQVRYLLGTPHHRNRAGDWIYYLDGSGDRFYVDLENGKVKAIDVIPP